MPNKPSQPAPMSKERIAEIRRRVEAATAGPWVVHKNPGEHEICIDVEVDLGRGPQEYNVAFVAGDVPLIDNCWDLPHWEADMHFIAHARQDIPDLTEALESAQFRVDWYRRRINMLAAWARLAESDLTEAQRRVIFGIVANGQMLPDMPGYATVNAQLYAPSLRTEAGEEKPNGMARVFGQWPGDESDEEIIATLKEIG